MTEDASIDEFVGRETPDPTDDDVADSTTDDDVADSTTDDDVADSTTDDDAADGTAGDEAADDEERIADGARSGAGTESTVDERVASVSPAASTSRYEPDGVACAACDAVVERLWVAEDGGEVCSACKSW